MTSGLPFVLYLNFFPKKCVLLYAIKLSSGGLGEDSPSKCKAPEGVHACHPALRGQTGSFRDPWQNDDGTKS